MTRRAPALLLPAGPPGSWEAVVDGWRPESLNNLLRLHWAARNRTLKAGYRRVALACLAAGVTRAKGRRRVSVVMTLSGRDKVLDEDNALKLVLDGLTHAGALVDDSPRWLERGPLAQARGPARRTVVLIEDV